MPSVPTFTLAATPDGLGIRVTITNPGTDPEYNLVYRHESTVTPAIISGHVIPDGTFDDYNIRSGATQFYTVRAVDAGGTPFADSLTQSLSITLTNLTMHAVQKGAASNLYGLAYELLGATPQSRPMGRAVEIRVPPALSNAVVETGEVVNRAWSTQVLSNNFSLTAVEALEALAALKRTLCMRDPRGNILFGTLQPLTADYDINHTVSVQLVETDFVQAVATS